MAQESSTKKASKNGWTKEQDEYLESLVDKEDWDVISEKFNSKFPTASRSANDCAKRWQILLDKNETKQPWTIKEEVAMLIAHHHYKNKWAEMGTMLKGRSNNTIKNKFYSIFRRIRGKIKKFDYSYNSKLELLEIYYIISLVEYYLLNPTQVPKMKGKRGKDFIYSLVHNLDQKSVATYKDQIHKIGKAFGDMEDLFKDMADEHNIPYEKQTKEENKEKPKIDEEKIDLPPSHMIIEGVSAIKSKGNNNPVETNDLFINHLKVTEQDTPLAFDMKIFSPPALFSPPGLFSPPSLFSPPTLSAGPAAAAAGAAYVQCFNEEGFADASALRKSDMIKKMGHANFGQLQGGIFISPTDPSNSTQPGWGDTQFRFGKFSNNS